MNAFTRCASRRPTTPCCSPRSHGVLDLVHAQAVSRGEAGVTDPRNLITCIDVDNLAVHDRESERLFNDAGRSWNYCGTSSRHCLETQRASLERTQQPCAGAESANNGRDELTSPRRTADRAKRIALKHVIVDPLAAGRRLRREPLR